jgi:prepilin-type N-terminal cleavage/methylation domain-containing protein
LNIRAKLKKIKAVHGFTLLEVMVALTITGMALGGLFGVEASLVETMQARSMINFAQLNDERGDIFINLENDELVIIPGYELEPPERKTQASRQALRQYEVIDEDGELITSGTYWIELDLAE